MKRFLLVAAALVVSTSAFAQANGPIRQGTKCWAAVDQRGFGFLDQCADRREIAERAKKDGRIGTFDAPVTLTPTFGNDGGGGGGGGGGR